MFACRSNLSSGQILSCEYTVHPRWLNDGAENLWPENMPNEQMSQDEMELVEDEVVIEEPAPIDFDWVEERETEEAGTEDIIFEQDIPASLEEEVVIGAEVSEFDENENSDCCSQSSKGSERGGGGGGGGDSTKYSNQLPDAYVPESSSPKNLSKGLTPKLDKIKRPTVKFKQTLMVSKNLLILNQRNFAVDPTAGTSLLKSEIRDKSNAGRISTETQNVDTKFNVRAKVDSRIAKSLRKQNKQKYRVQMSSTKGKPVGINSDQLVGGKARKFVDIHGENITINHDVDECIPGGSDDTQTIDSQLKTNNNKVCKLT